MSLNPELYPPLAPVADQVPRPFWTVIVPAYKPQYLAQSLRSVIEQDPGADQMEILVLDDCSPQEIEPIVRQVCGERAAYLRQPRNLGTYSNENHGLALARGIWIHILNDDDWVLPGFYQTFRQALENQPPTVGAACCWQSNVDSSGRELARQPLLRDSPGLVDDMLSHVSAGNPTHPVGTVIRRSTFEHLGGFYSKLEYCADWDFNRRAAAFYDWWYEPRLMAVYRHHQTSLSRAGRASGAQLHDLQHCIEISVAYLPADRRLQLMAQSKEVCAAAALRMADNSLWLGELAAAIQQIEIGLEISRSPEILKQLTRLLSQPVAVKLQQLRPDLFKLISDPADPSPAQSDSVQR